MNVLIATYKHSAKNYIRFLQQMQVSSFTLSDINDSKCHCIDLFKLDFDILLLPGGGDLNPAYYLSKQYETISTSDDALDLLQFQLLQLAILKKKPVLGICKGMQLIQLFFGGTLIPDLTTSAKHKSAESDLLHEVLFDQSSLEKIYLPKENTSQSKSQFFAQQNIITQLSSISHVNSAHHQGVLVPADDFLTIHRSTDHVVETMLHQTLPILGLQWHPERLGLIDTFFYRDLLNNLLQI